MAVKRAVLAVLLLTACGGMEARDARHKAAMIEEAKAMAAEESTYAAESLAFVATFTVDTVAARFDSIPPVPPPDLDGAYEPERRFYARSARGAVCEVTDERYAKLAAGDTLRCQWSPPK